MIRLDKYLADMGLGTRSELKKAIRSGRVSVNHRPALKPELKLDETKDTVEFDGSKISYRTLEYWMLHKPAGVVSATRDSRQRTVLDLLGNDRRKDLFPVGRLDKDTEGLLLITNDGNLAHRLLAPGKHVDKTYFARIDQKVDQSAVLAFEKGMDIGDAAPTMPAKLVVLSCREYPGEEGDDRSPERKEESEVLVTIREGRYHQIKRMFAALGMHVTYLKRLSMGGLVLDEHLEKGKARRLTEEELNRLC